MKSFYLKLSVGSHAFFITFCISIISLIKTFLRINHVDVVDKRLKYWSRMLLNKIQLKCIIKDPHHLTLKEGRPYIFMCNHSSAYDIPISLSTLPGSIRMLVKKELVKIPVWGRAMIASGFVSIDRQNRLQAFEDLKKAKKAMEQGIVLLIFPEGTRSKDGKLLPLKKGGFRLAIETGATVVPIALCGTHTILPAKSLAVNIGKSINVNIGKPIDASQYKQQTRGKLIQEVESQIREMIGQND